MNIKDLKVITCTGYYNTGSSAVGDLLREFSNVQDYGDYEIRIAHEPDGLSDLEYNIVENNHRHNTSNAIKRFLRLCQYYNGNLFSKRYRVMFGNDFYTLCQEYVNRITQLKCKSWWQFDQIYKGKLIYCIDVLYSRLYKAMHFWKDPSQIRGTLFCKNELAYFSNIDEKTFLKETIAFTDKLLEKCWDGKSSYIVLDQLVPPTNINRYRRYFCNLKTIVVDRDPRDVFLLEMENPFGVAPTDVTDFCEWYKLIRSKKGKEPYDPDCVLQIQFEDMIYDYRNTSIKICDFVGLNYDSIEKEFSFFNPEVSIKNTHLWEKNKSYKKEIAYIENTLPEFLYNYDALGNI